MLEVEVRPPWPFRLPSRTAPDGVLRVDRRILTRLLYVDNQPIVVRAWQRRDSSVVFRAAPPGGVPPATGPAGRRQLETAIERMRFALGVDDDLREFYDRFRRDRLLGSAIRARPWVRPRRRAWPWEALAWAITKQLIESSRAAAIQRRLVLRWGAAVEVPGAGVVRDVPSAHVVSQRAPAEFEALDLSAGRAVALIRVAREVAARRVDPASAADDRRLLAISGIGPWTVRCLGLNGRGEADSLPAGDLAYLKLVGRLAGLGRRATPEEVEEYLAPYAPFRGLAGTFALVHWHKAVAAGPPLRIAA